MNTNPRFQMPLKFKPGFDDCQRCGRDLHSQPFSAAMQAPANKYRLVCSDVHACHRRMMQPRLRLLPGGASY